MGVELDRFLKDNPNLKKVKGDDEEAVLMWAQENGYIRMDSFRNEYYYSEEDFNEAVMWAEKTGWNKDGSTNKAE